MKIFCFHSHPMLASTSKQANIWPSRFLLRGLSLQESMSSTTTFDLQDSAQQFQRWLDLGVRIILNLFAVMLLESLLKWDPNKSLPAWMKNTQTKENEWHWWSCRIRGKWNYSSEKRKIKCTERSWEGDREQLVEALMFLFTLKIITSNNTDWAISVVWKLFWPLYIWYTASFNPYLGQ